MKKYLFALMTFFTIIVTQGLTQVTFQKIASPGGFGGGKILQSKFPPFEYVVLYDFGFGAYLAKHDTLGSLLWTKVFGATQFVSAIDFIQTADEGYIIAGSISILGKYDGCLIKTDKDGSLLWTKVYGDSSSSGGFRSIYQTNDGGYIIAGVIQIGNNDLDAYIIKSDSTCNILWAKYFGRIGGAENPYDIIQTSDGGFLLTGSDGNSSEILLTRLDSIGNIIWNKNLGGNSSSDDGLSIVQATNGNFLLASQTSFGSGPASLIQFDINGNIIWSKTYGGSVAEFIYSINKTNDGGYICAGTSLSFGGENTFLLKVDSIGNVVWSHIYGKQNFDKGFDAIHTRDNGYLILGAIDGYQSEGDPFNLYLIKTDSLGFSGCNENSVPINDSIITVNSVNITQNSGILGTMSTYSISTHFISVDSTLCTSVVATEQIISTNNSINIYPNPFSRQTTLQTDKFFNDATVTVYSSMGQQLKQIKNISGQAIILHRDNLPVGLYFIRLTQDDKIFSSDKIVITDN